MRLIVKIAKAELRYLFYSPIAWFVIIAFLVLCANAWANIVPTMALQQELALENSARFTDWGKSLTRIIVGQSDNLFHTIIRYLYLFIPLLSMGVISRESVNGTNKLLFSSPLRMRQIVAGKFLGMMVFNLALVSIAGIFLVMVATNVQSADSGLLVSAALGFYLLSCAYSAIAMFMSSLTNYQVVSAISTFVVLAFLTYVAMFFQRYEFVRDLTWFLALPGRTEKFINGLITTKDLCYFLIVTVMFICFTLIRLKGINIARPWHIQAGKYMTVIVAAVLLGYVSSRPALTGYWDTTAHKVNTLKEPVQQIMKNFGDDSLEITLYTNLLGMGTVAGLPEGRNSYLTNPWERYIRFKPDIRFRYEYYYESVAQGTDSTEAMKKKEADLTKENARELAKSMYDYDLSFFSAPEEMRKKVDLRPENLRLVMQVKYKGRTAFLRTFDDPTFWPEDPEISAALKRVQKEQIPVIYFLTGNLERNIFKNGEREYSAHSTHKGVRVSLVNRGFDCDTLNLDWRNIPANATALVLPDPKTALSSICMEKLRTYISSGGNLLIFGEPGKQEMLNPLLQQLGVRLADGQLVQPSYNYGADRITPFSTNETGMLSQGWREGLAILKKEKQKFWGLMPGATSIDKIDSGKFNVFRHLITSGNAAWLKKGNLVPDSAAPVFNRVEGDSAGSFATAIALTRMIQGKEQKIAITGDADFAGNLRLGKNFGYLEGLYSWMNGGEFPVYAPDKRPLDVLLSVSSQTANFLQLTWLWIVPVLLTGFATILLIRRRGGGGGGGGSK